VPLHALLHAAAQPCSCDRAKQRVMLEALRHEECLEVFRALSADARADLIDEMRGNRTWSDSVWHAAIRHCRLTTIQFFLQLQRCWQPCSNAILRAAAEQGGLDLLRWMRSQDPPCG
jgi:hypothetical protein